MTEGVDYSAARYTSDQLKAAGVAAVGRYLTGLYAISRDELIELVDGGIAVWFIFEQGINNVAGGIPQGVTDAKAANTALGALELPATQPVYFTIDEDLENPQEAVPYFQGIVSVRAAWTDGDYAEGAVCELLQADGLAAFPWQSESTGFVGNATTLPITALQQKYVGAPLPDTDLDLILKSDFGQYPRPAAVPSSPTGGVYMIPTGCTDTGAVQAQIKEWWVTYRSDTLTSNVMSLLMECWALPAGAPGPFGSSGFGANPFLLESNIIDTAGSHLRPQFAGAV